MLGLRWRFFLCMLLLGVEVTALRSVEAQACDADDKGYEYVSPDRSATVIFPARPRESPRTVRTRAGEVRLQLATYATADGDVLLFGYADVPPAAVADPDVLLQGLAESLVQTGANITLKKIVYGEQKLPGREVVWRKDHQHLRARYILRDRRLYQIVVLGSESFVNSKTALDFFASFALR